MRLINSLQASYNDGQQNSLPKTLINHLSLENSISSVRRCYFCAQCFDNFFFLANSRDIF